jgi:Lrp/AsnC family transcriptional regulator, leucine-responsive regulatory protein
MDELDRRLLEELQHNCRQTMSVLGRRVGLSPSAVADRVRRLEEGGAILGYRAELDPKALGYEMAAILRIRPMIGQLKRVAEVAAVTPEVIECQRVTGEDCYVMNIVFRSIDELEELIDRFTPFGQTTTSIVNATPVPRRGLPVD